MIKGPTAGLFVCLTVCVPSVSGASEHDGRTSEEGPVAALPAHERQNSTEETPLLNTKNLPVEYDYIAPDGSEVRLLVRGETASMAQFRLPSGRTSAAVAHRSVEELWYVISGRGQMWRKQETGYEDVVDLLSGVSVSLPPGTHFQFRSTGPGALEVMGVTVPAWPGAEEAYPVAGKWPVSPLED